MGGRVRARMRTHMGIQGFTLVETMITLVVVAIVGVALFQVMNVSRVNVEEQKATLEAQQNARVALNSIAEDFRHVSYGKDATQPSIVYATDDSVVFVADIFENSGAEVISYYLSPDGDADTPNPTDTILMKTVTDTSGTVLVDAPQSYGIGASGLQMRFFTGDNNELSVPVSEPETIGEIRLLVSGVSPRPVRGGSYYTVTLSSTIYPRNLPLTPARARPNPPGFNGAEIPTCESITIKWTIPTTNTDGTSLLPNDISHFNFYISMDGGDDALNARLNRTITERTVPDLEAGHEYKFKVTCVSRAGVESYPMTRVVDLVSGLQPEQVVDVDVEIQAQDALLTWPAVASFTDGSTIVTPVYYEVYEGDTPAFTPGPTNRVGTTAEWETTYTAAALTACADYFYKVVAFACANPGEPSPAVEAVVPAMISCPSPVDAVPGPGSGEIVVSWATPTSRVDGSSLSPSDIEHFEVYVDTTSAVGAHSLTNLVSSDQTSTTLTMPGCDTYYVNVRAVDACATPGDLCPAEEVTVTLGSPCAPGAPVAPDGLVQSAGDTNIQLTWNANTEDCDLEGYRIWYGHSAGGPYNGGGAAQGNSPIAVDADDVTSGGEAAFSLTGLSGCSSYYVAVTAYDVCDPFEESDFSNEVYVDTACLPCTIAMTCSPVYSRGDSNEQVVLGLHSPGGDQTVDEMTLTWARAEGLDEVWVDGTRVWSSDGADGSDPPQSPVASGTAIHPDAFTVDGASSGPDGHRVDLVFTGDMRGETLFLDMAANTGACSVQGYVEESLVLDDFDDGDYNGWTVQSGNWSVSSNSLYQSNESGNFQWIHTSVLSYGGDFIVEADLNVTSGGYALVQFNRDATDRRYIAYLSVWAAEGHLGRLTGSYTDFGYGDYGITNGTWHKSKVVREGNVYKLYGNCALIAEVTASPDPPAGRFGFGAYYSRVRFDDIVIVKHDAAAAAARY